MLHWTYVQPKMIKFFICSYKIVSFQSCRDAPRFFMAHCSGVPQTRLGDLNQCFVTHSIHCSPRWCSLDASLSNICFCVHVPCFSTCYSYFHLTYLLSGTCTHFFMLLPETSDGAVTLHQNTETTYDGRELWYE